MKSMRNNGKRIAASWKSCGSLQEKQAAPEDSMEELYHFILKVSETKKGRAALDNYMVEAVTKVSDARSLLSIKT